MKKIILISCCSMALLTNLNAQQRNCGTMEYLEYRKKLDPSLEQRMAEDEQRINEWAKKHPSKAEVVNLPAIEQFTPTGNIETDKRNYSKAKELFLKTTGTVPMPPQQDPAKRDALRKRKIQKNKFISQ